ncbi:hypothetical protein AcW1_008910 [Taiwanofungus camphoratus]|nr:hypothetical protein AcV5_006940 [Antrodia cinnamomea]KAI0949236.1 hypothetical protein AcW1_008910 [Antrodia cinnamomea]KAI0958942.1 hypothetical protein AcV7_004619 [Antrodia cinnamomea]
MVRPEVSTLGVAVITSVQHDNINESLEKLRLFLPDTLLVAALDLVDRDSVLKYVTPWGRVQYEVLGSTASYTVFPDLFYPGSSVHFYCTCPAFAYSVLSSESQLMCKHVLATLLAQRLSKCIERPINPNELAAIVVRQCS